MEAAGPRRVMLTADAVGGVWQYTIELAAGFAARGAEVLIVSLGPSPSSQQEAELAEVCGCDLRVMELALDWLASDAAQVVAASQELANIACTWGAETIQLHSAAYAALASWPTPVIAAAHSCVGTWWRTIRSGELIPDLAWRADLVARGLAAAHAVIAPSRSFARLLTETYDLRRSISVVWNGRRSFPVRRAPHQHAFTAGRLWDEAKNIGLLDAAAGSAGVTVRAAGATGGPNGSAIRCRNLDLLGCIGYAELAREYAHAACFVSPSLYEPFGLAALEAAWTGCPLLLSDIPTFRELWDGAACFVDPSDSDLFAAVLRQMVRAPNRYEALGEAARERAQRYAPDVMAEATWAIHRNALAAAQAVAA